MNHNVTSPISVGDRQNGAGPGKPPTGPLAPGLQVLSNALAAAANAVIITDPNGLIQWTNPAFTALTGYTAAEALGRNSRELINSGQQSADTCRDLWQTVTSGLPWRGELINRRKDGSLYVEQQIIMPVRDDNGHISNFIAFKQDVSEQKRADEALRESEEKYRLLFELESDALFLIDNETGRILEGNSAASSLYGFSYAELLGLRNTDLSAEPDQTRRATVEGASHIGVRWHRKKDGTVFPVEITATHLVFRGRPSHLAAIRDITERLRVDQQLRAAEARYRSLVEQVPAIVYTARLDDNSSKLYISPQVEAVLGYPLDAWQSDPDLWARCLHPDDRERVLWELRDSQQAGRAFRAEYRMLTRDGGVVWIRDEARQICDEHGQPMLLQGVMLDITDRKQAEVQIERQMARLHALRTIDTAITTSYDLRVTLAVLLDQVTAQLDVHAAAVLLLDPQALTLQYAAGRGFRTQAIQSSRVRLGSGHAGQAALERRSVYVPRLREANPPFRQPGLAHEENFVGYVAVPLTARGDVKGVIELFHRAPLAPDPEWQGFLEVVAGQLAVAIENAQLFEHLQRMNTELIVSYDATIEGWSRALDLRDKETEGHTQRVTELTVRLGQRLGISDEALVHVRRGALLHDIGKMAIPDSILLKPGPLNDEEWATMKQHPTYALDMLAPIAYLRQALDIPYCHHEKWDGTGYPQGLRDGQIPLAARVFAVVDVWDALTSDRPYRRAWSPAQARDYIREQAGRHFDPTVVEAFLQMELDV